MYFSCVVSGRRSWIILGVNLLALPHVVEEDSTSIIYLLGLSLVRGKGMLNRICHGIIFILVLLSVSLLMSIFTFTLNIQLVEADPGVIIVPDHYPTIQSAVDHAYSGDAIYVRAGTYFERVYIDSRSNLQIEGENPVNTTVDSGWTGSAPGPFNIEDSYNITITGFTITTVGYGVGIDVHQSQYCTLTGNRVLESDVNIALQNDCHNNTISNNILVDGSEGIYLFSSWGTNPCTDNVILNNNITSRGVCVFVECCDDNRIVGNRLSSAVATAGYANVWDYGYPSGGNYWSEYPGVDLYSGPFQNETGSDGIGDTPLFISTGNIDNYPLMPPYITRPWDLTGPVDWMPDRKCDIRDVAIVSVRFGSAVGDGVYDVRADITGPTYLVKDGKIDIRDIALVALHFGETY